MSTINTEFKADLAGIQAHIDDLGKAVTTLYTNLGAFGGVKKRLYNEWTLGDGSDASQKAAEKYAADLQDAYKDVALYKGYVQSLYDSLTTVKSKLEAIQEDAKKAELEVDGYTVKEPKDPGKNAAGGDQTDYNGKKSTYDSLKERSKTARTNESTAHSTFQANCKKIFKCEIDPITGDWAHYPMVFGMTVGPSLLHKAVEEAKPEISDEPDQFAKLGDYAKAIGLPEQVVSIADELGDFIPKGGAAEQILKGIGKATSSVDVGVNMLQGVTSFQSGYEDQYENAKYNPENSEADRKAQSTLRGAWESAPTIVSSGATVAGSFFTPIGAAVFGTAADWIGKGLHDTFDGLVETGINYVGVPDWLDWTD